MALVEEIWRQELKRPIGEGPTDQSSKVVNLIAYRAESHSRAEPPEQTRFLCASLEQRNHFARETTIPLAFARAAELTRPRRLDPSGLARAAGSFHPRRIDCAENSRRVCLSSEFTSSLPEQRNQVEPARAEKSSGACPSREFKWSLPEQIQPARENLIPLALPEQT
ncbi:uncharacterized protein LOC131024664 [Salvia miltiorrhiza]|uniref:uncharacterized protein LOC131024664 n=1 Tax=Salvia miltiorrhiza TaxID=226208 RepID=UPI0025AC3F4D|nr:uncharacterized protein LOC131024664 [Salvia miltiorrhiza]